MQKQRTIPLVPKDALAKTTGGLAFVDESKHGDYLLIAAILQPNQLAMARRTVRGLILPGQHRVHMKKESEPRKRQILSAITNIGPTVVIYRARKSAYRTELLSRAKCIDALVAGAARDRHLELVLELDVRLERSDRQRLVVATRAHGCSDRLAHRHSRAAAEPLLVIPDAVGWAWARGGDWRRRCLLIDVNVVDV